MIDDIDRRIIKRVCGDISDSLHPFRDIAAEIGVEEGVLLERLRSYREKGMLRRFGAILRHQKAGYVANAMSVWNVPKPDVARVGELMTKYPEISHCYERPAPPDWPYTLYGMIHGRTKEDCLAVAARVSGDIGIDDYHILFSVREFKKTSMVYLDNDD